MNHCPFCRNELFHEDLNSALAHLVSALGGPKKVGNQLWPSLSIDGAARKVHHCLNDQHQQDFKPNEVIWLLREARKKGVHSAMSYVCGELGYQEPVELNPETEAEKLQREFIQAMSYQKTLADRMEKLTQFTKGAA